MQKKKKKSALGNNNLQTSFPTITLISHSTNIYCIINSRAVLGFKLNAAHWLRRERKKSIQQHQQPVGLVCITGEKCRVYINI